MPAESVRMLKTSIQCLRTTEDFSSEHLVQRAAQSLTTLFPNRVVQHGASYFGPSLFWPALVRAGAQPTDRPAVPN